MRSSVCLQFGIFLSSPFYEKYLKISKLSMHIKCRNNYYPRSNNQIKRGNVPDGMVEWNAPFPDYQPMSYTSPGILSRPSYADPQIDKNFSPKWNSLDGKIDRRSYHGTYEIVDAYPRNMKGRTGIIGRGCLGRWGPNHAADPVVTRWKLDAGGNKIAHNKTGMNILQFVSIQRKDNGEWAIPGGMVDPGEKVTAAVQREFMEEALNSLMMTDEQKEESKQKLTSIFSGGQKIYAGYVDDPRNTDNAWMETVAYNFHDESSNGILYKLNLNAGDDAKAVQWTDIMNNLNLYASHKDILRVVAEKLDAHW